MKKQRLVDLNLSQSIKTREKKAESKNLWTISIWFQKASNEIERVKKQTWNLLQVLWSGMMFVLAFSSMISSGGGDKLGREKMFVDFRVRV